MLIKYYYGRYGLNDLDRMHSSKCFIETELGACSSNLLNAEKVTEHTTIIHLGADRTATRTSVRCAEWTADAAIKGSKPLHCTNASWQECGGVDVCIFTTAWEYSLYWRKSQWRLVYVIHTFYLWIVLRFDGHLRIYASEIPPKFQLNQNIRNVKQAHYFNLFFS